MPEQPADTRLASPVSDHTVIDGVSRALTRVDAFGYVSLGARPVPRVYARCSATAHGAQARRSEPDRVCLRVATMRARQRGEAAADLARVMPVCRHVGARFRRLRNSKTGEVALPHQCGRSQPVMGAAANAPQRPVIAPATAEVCDRLRRHLLKPDPSPPDRSQLCADWVAPAAFGARLSALIREQRSRGQWMPCPRSERSHGGLADNLWRVLLLP